MGYNFLNTFFQNLRHYDSNSSLKVDGFDPEDENALLINTHKNTKLYCIEIATGGNDHKDLSENKINFIFEEFKKDSNSQLISAVMVKKEYQKNYLFSFHKELLKLVAAYYKVELLQGHKIIDVLYDLYFHNEYFIEKKKILPNLVPSKVIEYENMTHSINTLTKEAVYKNLEEVAIYQGVEYLPKNEHEPRNYQNFISKGFNGVIWTYMAFDKKTTLATLTRKKNQAMMEGTHNSWKKKITAYNNGEEDIGVVNTMIFTWDKHEKKNLLNDAKQALKCNFVEKSRYREDLIKFTPLKKRDILQGDKVLNKKNFYGLISSFYKKDSIKPVLNAHGPQGEFVNFGFQYPAGNKKNSVPHFLLLGPSGAGKSVTLQKSLSLIIDYDWESKKALSLRANNLRLFDIKDSMKKLTLEVAQKNNVSQMKTDLNNFRFNLVNIDTININGKVVVDKTDLAFMIMLTNLILDARGVGGKLTSGESEIFKLIVTKLYENGNLDGVFIKTLRLKNPKLYEKLIALGYNPTDKTKDIKEAQFNQIKKPLLSDVIKKLQEYVSEKERYGENDKFKDASSLRSKLETINMMGHWSNYDQIDLKTGEYIYVDLDSLKDDNENFIPIYFAIFSRIYRADKAKQSKLLAEGKPRPLIYYIWEEAYNFLSVPEFGEIFKKLVNEARSYGIVLGFITQLLEHIPNSIAKQISNKFFLFPGEAVSSDNGQGQEEVTKEDIIQDISTYLKPPKHVIENCYRTPEHGVMVWHEFGSFVMKYELGTDITEQQMKVFESETTQIAA